MSQGKRKLLEEIGELPRGVAGLMLELFELELEDARLELENTQAERDVWRNQGRCMELRNLMSLIRQGQKYGQ